MDRGKLLKRLGLGFVGIILTTGCPILETAIVNPRVLDPRYKFSEEDLIKYNRWIELTLQESRQNGSNSIIVNKSTYELFLIKEGLVASKFPIDLGANSIDDKQKEGDMCTPEGMYIVQRKLGVNQTAFHKAFLLNYPNMEDKRLGKTGSLIEIHGKGTGKLKVHGGYNWTWGCIALSDEDIDRVFPYINQNDRITIVRYTDKILDAGVLN